MIDLQTENTTLHLSELYIQSDVQTAIQFQAKFYIAGNCASSVAGTCVGMCDIYI